MHHFSKTFDDPDPDNGMWIVKLDVSHEGCRVMSVIHLNSVVHVAHLLPIFAGNTVIPREISFSDTVTNVLRGSPDVP